jgi:hypothetical protein
MSRKLRKSFVRHPGAILFLLFSREGVFQHPRLITTVGRDSGNLPIFGIQLQEDETVHLRYRIDCR